MFLPVHTVFMTYYLLESGKVLLPHLDGVIVVTGVVRVLMTQYKSKWESYICKLDRIGFVHLVISNRSY